MGVTVGVLTIDLKANTASFSQGMEKMAHLSAKTATDVKRSLEKIATAGLAMAAGFVAGTDALVEKSMHTIGTMGKLAQASGTTVTRFSELAYVAMKSHVELEDMAKALEKVSFSAFKAQNGNSVLANIFEKLGVSIEDGSGHLRDSADIYGDVSVKFSQMASGAGKTGLAMALMGKAGAGNIPMMNKYGAHMSELTEEAKRFGMVIGNDVPAKVKAYREVFNQLHAAQAGFGIQLTVAILPALQVLSTRLQEIGKNVNIPDLAKAFGEKAVGAINLLVSALKFGVDHAHALKIALEALAAIQLTRFIAPFLLELATAGTAVGGINLLTSKVLGLNGVILGLRPAFTALSGWLSTQLFMLKGLAAEEGIAAAATYFLGGVAGLLLSPITIAVGAIGLIIGAMYELRDSTFSASGELFKFRDAYMALAMVIKSGGMLGFGAALDAAKAGRESEEENKPVIPGLPVGEHSELKPPNTSGLGREPKDKKDIYGEELTKLNLAISAQQKYISVLGATPDVIAAVASAEKAEALILELNNKLHDSQRAKLNASQQAMLRQKIATEESLKAIAEFGKEIVSQQHSTDLATSQTNALTVAIGAGDEALRKIATDNLILGLTLDKTTGQLKAASPELEKLRVALNAKSNSDTVNAIAKEVDALGDELAMRKIVTAAVIQGGQAYRENALQSGLYTLNESIKKTTDAGVAAQLQAKKDALIEAAHAEWALADAEAARSLRSPLELYQEETDDLLRQVEALRKSGDGVISYGQSMVIAGRAQDAFTRLTDETITELLRFGSAREGVNAFFLDMQKSAKSTASIIYDAMHSAFDKISDNLTELVTGGKTSFGKMFQDVGKQLVNSTIRQGLQTGLGSLGAKMGINLGGAIKNDGSTQSTALWVRFAGNAGLTFPGSSSDPLRTIGAAGTPDIGVLSSQLPGEGGALGDILKSLGFGGNGPLNRGNDSAGGIMGTLSGLFGKIFGGISGGIGSLGGLFGGGSMGGGILSFISQLIPHFETGGMAPPSGAYLVGENGPELMQGASGNIASSADTKRLLNTKSGDSHYYSIDARGTDPMLVEQRVKSAIIAAHNNAVSVSVQATTEQGKRSPQR